MTEANEISTLPTTVNPMAILDKMVAQGVDPDKLGRVIDLIESWNKNRAVEAAEGVERHEWKIPANTVLEKTVTDEEWSTAPLKIADLQSSFLLQLVQTETMSKPVKEALFKIIAYRDRIASADTEIGIVESRIKAILAEQDRIRTLAEKLPAKSAVLDRLLKKLDENEIELEKTRDTARTKTAARDVVQKEMTVFVAQLDVE